MFLLLTAILVAPITSAQTNIATQPSPPAHIVFDVVSVKPNHTMTGHPGPMIRSDSFDAENITPIWVMYWAFGCDMDRDERHFSGLPGWVKSERFDIIAKVADADVPAWKKLPDSEKERMVREVLADRFKLVFHRESHEQPVYALVVAKGGSKMTPVEVPASDHLYDKYGYVGPEPGGIGGEHANMKALIDFLNGQKLGREVVDRTGLTGNYDFMLKFTPFPMDASPDDVADPSGSPYPYIFTALQEQLGLKLESTRGPVETLVIDHMERPSEN
ncbi:MAG: TIGR03435 family protein [Acidobacteriaceae bacterium]